MKTTKTLKASILVVSLTTMVIFATLSYCSAGHVQFLDAAPPTVTSISCSVASSSLSLGQAQVTSGSISPTVTNVTVTLTYTKPDGSTLNRDVSIGAEGSYSDTYDPDAAGSWTVKASWAGNINYLGSTSFATPFTVKGNSSSSLPTEYIYIAIAAVVIIILAVALFLWNRSRQKTTKTA